jgi:hypothetical protein
MSFAGFASVITETIEQKLGDTSAIHSMTWLHLEETSRATLWKSIS